jgi:tetratricopeptide (TPR) repeat protein
MANDLIAERVAALNAEAGNFDRALAILKDTYFFPWEIYRGVRILYEDANIGKGLKLLQGGDYEKAAACFQEVMRYPRNIGVGESWRKANAEAWYWIGVAQEKSGDVKSAPGSWTKAADEPRPAVSALSYFRAKALRKLGREKEAIAVLRRASCLCRGQHP